MTKVEEGKVGLFASKLEISEDGAATFGISKKLPCGIIDVPGALAMSSKRFETLKAEAKVANIDLHTYLATYMGSMID